MSKLSVVVPTNKPHLWSQFCATFAKLSIEIEMIFIGPYDHSDVQLPIPVRYLKTDTNKVALCWEIGARAAQNDFLCLSCDDWTYSDGFFEDSLKLAATSKNVYDTFTGRLMTNNVDCTAGQMMCGYKSMPLLSVAGVGFMEGHHKIGGIDKRFHATLWDSDLYTRMYVEGGRPTLLPGHVSHEIGFDSDLSKRFMPNDHPILLSLWCPNGIPTLQRTSPVLSYTDEEARC